LAFTRPELAEASERVMHKNAVHFFAYGWHPLIPEKR
jgi:hypothetical protein